MPGEHSIPVVKYTEDSDDLIKYYEMAYPTYNKEFVIKNAIDSNGDVVPVKRWMIDMAYDILS